MTPYTALPEGWRLLTHRRLSGGCLEVRLDYRDEALYSVIWHINDMITFHAVKVDGTVLALDPTVVMLAMMLATERCWTPNYSLRAWHPHASQDR